MNIAKPKEWRPKDWDIADYCKPDDYCEHILINTKFFEAGASAMLETLLKLASESPNHKFIIYGTPEYLYVEDKKE